MLMDLGLNAISLPINGRMPANTGLRLSLKSLYSNRFLFKAIPYTIKQYNEWFEITFDNPGDFTNQGVEGYYELLLEYYDNNSWYQFNNFLVKCDNSLNTLDTPKTFISDNDDNENYVFYQS